MYCRLSSRIAPETLRVLEFEIACGPIGHFMKVRDIIKVVLADWYLATI